MNLYRISASLPFLEILADFIVENFSGREAIDNLKVILPTGMACVTLQNILVNKHDIVLLPKIIPISNVSAEGLAIFNIPAEQLEVIPFLQEKIILTNIIHNYPKLKFNLKQALQFSSVIAELFYELASHNLSIVNVNEIEQKNPSEQWDAIYEFLHYIYQQWQQKLIYLQKPDQAAYHIIMMEAELARLQHSNSSLIIAGIVGHNPISWQFLKDVANFSKGYIILPPIGDIADLSLVTQPLGKQNCLYNFKKLLELLGKDLSDFQPLGPEQQPTKYNIILNKLLVDSDSGELLPKITPDVSHIKYFEVEDIFQEAKQIALICQQYSDKKIAIIIDNSLTKPFYCNFLTKYSLEFQDLLGDNLSQALISSLIISISEILCNNFDIRKLFLLLKHPLINFKLVQELELLIRGKNRFILSTEQLLLLIKNTNNHELIEWGEKIVSLLYQNTDNSFIKILTAAIKVAETLYPDIWYELAAFELSNFLSELIKIKENLLLENKEIFPNILKTLMSGSKYFDDNNYAKNIIIGRMEDLVLLKFDLVILADFNQYKSPSCLSISSWINDKTLEELQVTLVKTATSISQYFFYLLLHNDQVIITRAKRQNGKAGLLPADLLLKLQFILGDKLTPQSCMLANGKIDSVNHSKALPSNKLNYIRLFSKLASGREFEGDEACKTTAYGSVAEDLNLESLSKLPAEVEFRKKSIHSPIFPDILSVTNIELLVRNPYSFYAKTILNLKRKETIGQDPKISEFGVFIHKILEQYSKKYDELHENKVQSILDISHDILHSTNWPSYTQKIWQTKFSSIAEPFVIFDEERRKFRKYIYPECSGELSLTIAGQDLKIVAVADRIEVDGQGRAVIVDYKTGVLPTKKDIENGLSPQLIIEALILEGGGFGVKVHNVEEVVYVKFSSSPPYLQTTTIELSKEVLNKHKQGMLNLLEYYITNKNFSYNLDLLTYNDYAHLARIMVK